MSEQVNLGFRIPIAIAKEIDVLVKSNRYKNKTDVIVTALRLLITQEKPLIQAKQEKQIQNLQSKSIREFQQG